MFSEKMNSSIIGNVWGVTEENQQKQETFCSKASLVPNKGNALISMKDSDMAELINPLFIIHLFI